MERKQTREIKIGNVKIGNNNPIAIQSMCNTKTEDAEATIKQILRLEAAGCDIIRCAVPHMEAAKAFSEIKKMIQINLVSGQGLRRRCRELMYGHREIGRAHV